MIFEAKAKYFAVFKNYPDDYYNSKLYTGTWWFRKDIGDDKMWSRRAAVWCRGYSLPEEENPGGGTETEGP